MRNYRLKKAIFKKKSKKEVLIILKKILPKYVSGRLLHFITTQIQIKTGKSARYKIISIIK